MWQLLRDRKLCGLKFRRQYPFGSYVLDFYCHEEKLGIELDGGQHNEDEQASRDKKRTLFLEGKGIKIIRFWNHEILQETEHVLEYLYYTLTLTLSQRERGNDETRSVGEGHCAYLNPLTLTPLPYGREGKVALTSVRVSKGEIRSPEGEGR